MIHILVGTKAQFIKMAPLMKGLQARNIPYNLVNLGQHEKSLLRLSALFDIPLEEEKGKELANVSDLAGMFAWFLKHLFVVAFRPGWIKNRFFKGEKGVAVIHGDTASTLLGLLMAKRSGIRVAHLESGLRSGSYLHPFPEELIRVICMKAADYLFAPCGECRDNLHEMNLKGKIYTTGGNTGQEAMKLVLNHDSSEYRPDEPYVLFSIHRFETLYSKKRTAFVLDMVRDVAERFHVLFVMHDVTQKRLGKRLPDEFNLNKSGTSSGFGRLRCLPLQDYGDFISLLGGAQFVVTDGGTVQEECLYLGKPCLILRKKTEREHGIGENAVLCNFDRQVARDFEANFQRHAAPVKDIDGSPSNVIADELMKL